MDAQLGSRQLVSIDVVIILPSYYVFAMIADDITRQVVADAIKRYGACSIPYLQRKCKLTYVHARSFLEKFKLDLHEISSPVIVQQQLCVAPTKQSQTPGGLRANLP